MAQHRKVQRFADGKVSLAYSRFLGYDKGEDGNLVVNPEQAETVRNRHSGVHIFSSKIKCGQCGSWYGSKVWHSNDKYRKVIWQCNHKFEGEKCSTPHLDEEDIKAAFIRAANKLLDNKGGAIAAFEAAKDTVLSTAALQKERDELLQEINVLTEMIQKSIYENARIAQDQEEYQKNYEGLTGRYDAAKERYNKVSEELQDKTSRREAIEYYIEILRKQDEAITEFDARCRHGMVDYATVYAKDDIRFTFMDGTEIRA